MWPKIGRKKKYYFKKNVFKKQGGQFRIFFSNVQFTLQPPPPPRQHCMEIDKLRNPVQPNDPGEFNMFKCVGTLPSLFSP